MKAAAFEYVRARSVAEAVGLLSSLGEGARLIAGGQSLLPAINLRLSSPTHLIDIGGIQELRGMAATGNGIRIGAGVRHADLERAEVIARHAPLIAEAVRHIAHPAIRNRGTMGGSLAHADPASELPACVLALDATLVTRSPKGERRIAAADFFMGIYATALAPNEILTAIEIPPRPAHERFHFAELSRRRGDYAMAGLACVARISGGTFQDVRPVFFGVGDKPLLAKEARSLILAGCSPNPADLHKALAKDVVPHNDLQASASMRLHLAGVLLRRALAELTRDKRAA